MRNLRYVRLALEPRPQGFHGEEPPRGKTTLLEAVALLARAARVRTDEAPRWSVAARKPDRPRGEAATGKGERAGVEVTARRRRLRVDGRELPPRFTRPPRGVGVLHRPASGSSGTMRDRRAVTSTAMPRRCGRPTGKRCVEYVARAPAEERDAQRHGAVTSPPGRERLCAWARACGIAALLRPEIAAEPAAGFSLAARRAVRDRGPRPGTRRRRGRARARLRGRSKPRRPTSTGGTQPGGSPSDPVTAHGGRLRRGGVRVFRDGAEPPARLAWPPRGDRVGRVAAVAPLARPRPDSTRSGRCACAPGGWPAAGRRWSPPPTRDGRGGWARAGACSRWTKDGSARREDACEGTRRGP